MKTLPLLLVMMLVAACGGDQTTTRGFDLTGTWVLDAEKTLQEIDAWPISEDEKKEARAFFGGAEMAAVEMVFGADGTTVARNRPGSQPPVEGTWRVTARDGNEWTVATHEQGKPEADVALFTWIDADHVMVVEEGQHDGLVLKRK